ncbi:hypothetical protein EYF80_065452 [Liparis tanakae]|uniref:Uncharacterized protein n=1 Tax=Liparis tanakae TaxID=230148 RepID=A0A4Z2E789_9TELE|nr:hypothetical protein EYF80_065452 [Liparis tanakae]
MRPGAGVQGQIPDTGLQGSPRYPGCPRGRRCSTSRTRDPQRTPPEDPPEDPPSPYRTANVFSSLFSNWVLVLMEFHLSPLGLSPHVLRGEKN